MKFIVTETLHQSFSVDAADGTSAISARKRGEGVLSKTVVGGYVVRLPMAADNPADWPLWAKALKLVAKPEDKGVGDIVARLIGDEKSEAFKAWYLKTFGKPCGCNGRQANWNRRYPITLGLSKT